MKLTYKGSPVVFKSQKSQKMFAAALLFVIPVGFIQLCVASIGIAEILPIPAVIIALVLGALSIELTFNGGSVFRLLPEVLRKEMVWIAGMAALIGFESSNNMTSTSALIFFGCVAYRALLSFIGWLNVEKTVKR